jgi:DNA-binding GntR family transcriptional regulator
MSVDILSRTSLATTPDALAEGMRERIRRGSYAPGQRLIEIDLAEEFGVGRGRIREVFRTLVGEGYLVFVENRGVYVRRFSKVEILEMGRVREVLEGLAARMAAERDLTSEQRSRLGRHQALLDSSAAGNDIDAYNHENYAYHATICDLSGNPLTAEFLTRVRLPLYRLQLPRSFTEDSMARSNRDHQVITSAILSGNPDAAEAAMRAHVRAGNQHVASLDERYFL